MKARFVYESLDFERGSSPKKAIGIGGINLKKIYDEIEKEANQKYRDFLNKSFLGKTITGTMDSWDGSHGNWKEWTIKVAKIEGVFNSPSFTFVDDKEQHYTVLTDSPIYVNESQKFERGVHPKQSLGIGGIALGIEKSKMKRKFLEDWNFFLTITLDGKTISAVMNKRNPGEKSDNWGMHTITIDSWEESENYNALILKDINGDSYILPIDDKKIYIENAR